MKIIDAQRRGFPRSFWRKHDKGDFGDNHESPTLLQIKISGKGSRRLYFDDMNDNNLKRFAYFNHCGKRVYVTYRAYNALFNHASKKGWIV